MAVVSIRWEPYKWVTTVWVLKATTKMSKSENDEWEKRIVLTFPLLWIESRSVQSDHVCVSLAAEIECDES